MKINAITILTKEEYNNYKHMIPVIKELWWLRTPGSCNNRVCSVNHEGCVYPSGSDIAYNIGVRPLLIIDLPMEDARCYHKSEKLAGSKIEYGDYTWTVLKAEAGVLYMLCDQLIANRAFDKATNIWEGSELKKWLENEALIGIGF